MTFAVKPAPETETGGTLFVRRGVSARRGLSGIPNPACGGRAMIR